MKKLLSLILAVVMLLTLVACGGAGEPETTKPPVQTSEVPETSEAPAVEMTSYTYTFQGMMGEETAQIDLYTDGTCQFFLPDHPMIKDVYAGTYTQEGATVSIVGLTNVDTASEYTTPGLWDWIVDGNATVTIDDAAKTFAPAAAAAEAVDVVGSYIYEFDGMMGKEKAQIDLAADGTAKFFLPDHPMIKDVYAGTYTANGPTVSIVGLTNVDTASEYTTPGLWDWIVDGNATVTVDVEAKTFAPGEAAVEGPAGPVGPASGDNGIDGIKNISYGSLSADQVLDAYTPEGVEKAPVIVLVHGGGFMFGDQGMDIVAPVINKALEHGYAVVAVDYRKSSEAVFPAALSDVKAAVRWVRAHAMEYGFDPEHIAVWGESAGAYLASMTALTPDVAALNGDMTEFDKIPNGVTALVSFYAPIEFYTMYDEAGKPESAAGSFESKFLGQDIMADKEKTYTTYWETYADQIPTDLKVWIQAGDADEKVPYTQSVNFATRLAGYIGEENVEHSIIPGVGHEAEAFYTDENLDAVFAWLDGFMK